MPRATHLKSNFTAGELSPRLEGRTDLQKYHNGAYSLLNFLIYPHGGLSRRGGTQYVAEVKDSTKKVRLYKFEFNAVQTYLLEIGHNYIRFHSHDSEGTWGPVGTAGVPYELATFYDEAHLSELKFAQTGDELYIVHPLYAPRILTRLGHLNWTLADITFIWNYLESSPWGSVAKPISAISLATPCQVTATSHGIVEGSPTVVYLDSIVGTTQLNDRFFIATYLDANNVTLTDLNGVAIDSSGYTAWSSGGNVQTSITYPSCCCFYEQRFFLAGSANDPQTIWGSRTGAIRYADMRSYYNNDAADAAREGDGANLDFVDGTVNSDDSLKYTIATDKINKILWLSPGKILVAGTVGGEFTITSTNLNEAITPTNIRIVRQSTYGSSDIQPERISDQVLFLQRASRKIRQFVYQFDSDSYVAPDLTILSEHISISGFTELSLQQEPDSVVWLVRADGALVGLTYQKDQDVIAWHPHWLAGVSDSSGSPAAVESLATVPSSYPTEYRDEVWVVVKRYINGATVRFIERLTEGLSATGTIEDSGFSDCGGSLHPRWWMAAPTTTDPQPITNIVKSGAVTMTFTSIAHEVVVDDYVRFRDIVETDGGDDAKVNSLNNQTFKVVTQPDANTFSINIDELDSTLLNTVFKDYVSGGNICVETLTVSGVNHLEGETVDVLVNGDVESPRPVVTGGVITLTTRGSKIHFGLPYISEAKTMRLDVGSEDGSAQGKIGRITDAVIRVHRTAGLQVGPDADNLEDIPWRTQSSYMNEPPELYSGDKKILYRKGHETDKRILLRQDKPLPCNILALVTTSRTNS